MFSHFFITRPKLAISIALVMVLVGVITALNLPMAQFPDIVPPIIEVVTSFPGADAITMEQTVVQPIEQQVNGAENMIYMFTQCSDQGQMVSHISFEVGTSPDMDSVNTLIGTSIAQPQLPGEVQFEGLTVKQKNTDILLILQLYSPDNIYDNIYLSNYAYLYLYDQIARIPGVGQVMLLGAQNYAIRVWLDPIRMASLKVTVPEVMNAIQVQNNIVPSGQLGGPPSVPRQQFEYTLLLQPMMSSVEEFRNIVVRGTPDGSLIKLRDVAKVELGSGGYNAYVKLDSAPTANLAVYIFPDANQIAVADSIYKLLEKMRPSFPKGMMGDIFYDTTIFIKISLSGLIQTLYIAILLVVLVVFIFLQNWRAALIPILSIPVSLIGACTVMSILGTSINTVSLFGLILATGIVVDDAIVVVENIHRLMEEGLPPIEAAKKSMDQVTGPVIATTCVLMVVFIPISFVPGITGRMLKEFSVTISSSLALSAINALTLSPALCVLLLKNESEKKKFFFFNWFNRGFDYLTRIYYKLVSVLIRKTLIVSIVFAILAAITVYLYTRIPTGFLPDEDQGLINIEVQLPSSASLVRTRAVMSKVEKILKETKGVAHFNSAVGSSFINLTATSNIGKIFVILDDWSKRSEPELSQFAIINQLKERLRKEVPEAYCFVFQRAPIAGLGTAGGLQFELEQIIGNKPHLLSQVLSDFIIEAEQQPEIGSAYSSYLSNIPKIKIHTNIPKIEKLGISLNDVLNTVKAYIGSIYVNEFFIWGKIFQVLVQARADQRSIIDDINNIYMQTKKGDIIPLRTLVNLESQTGPNIVNHYNMYANAEIQVAPAEGCSTGQAIQAMERVAKKILPEGFKYEWTGTAYEEIIAGNKTVYIFIISLVFIYLFLAGKYESWMLSLSVMLSVPVAVIGSIIALFVTGIANNIYAQVGFVLIFGMATKTAILIVEFADVHHKSGMSVFDAVMLASKERFRAILMTAFAFILGVFPLIIATGAGAVSMRSLGTVVFGGMLASAFLGTILVPCFYVIIENIVSFMERRHKPDDNWLK